MNKPVKKIRWYCRKSITGIFMGNAVSVLVLFGLICINCTAPNRHFTRSSSEIRTQVKKVLFLPLHIDQKDFFPAIPAAAMPIVRVEYPEKFRTDLRNALSRKAALIDATALSALQHGGFKFQVFMGTAKPSIIQKRQSPFGREKQLNWQYNQVYDLSPEAIRIMAKEADVDAIFFHYVQFHKIWEHMYSSTTTGNMRYTSENNIPRDVVIYMPQLYDKEGTLLYGGERLIEFQFRGRNFENSNGDVLVSLESVNSAWKLERNDFDTTVEIVNKFDEEYLSGKLLQKKRGALNGLYVGAEK